MTKITVDGISFNVEKDIFEDWDFLEALSRSQEQSDNPLTQMSALVEVFRMLCGKDFESVKSKLRKANKGKLTVETMSTFFEKTVQAVMALKNS